MSTEREIGAAGTPAREPDVGFQCGVGLSVGTVLAGVVSITLAAGEASTVSVFGSYPSAATGGLLVGIILSRNTTGMAEQIGADRTRWLYGLAPAVATGAVAALARAGGADRVALVALLAAVPIAVSGLVLAAMARNRYIDRVTGQPAAAWTWKRTGFFRREYVTLALIFLWPGFILLSRGQPEAAASLLFVLLVVAAAGIHRLRILDDSEWLDQWDSNAVPELAVHEVGLVRSEGLTKSLIPWSKVEGVSLTDDELVIDRGWRSIRCDTAVIDDPKGVYRAIRDRLS